MVTHSSPVAGWLLAAVCAVTGLVSLLRARGSLLRAGGTAAAARGAAGSEALMGFAMAATALPLPAGLSLPPAVTVPPFCAVCVWELWLLLPRLRHTPGGAAHRLHHLVGAAAMTAMASAAALPCPAGVTAALPPVLWGALPVYYAGYVLVGGVRLLSPRETEAAGPAAGVLGSCGPPAPCGGPGLAAACRLAMGTGMFAMLLSV